MVLFSGSELFIEIVRMNDACKSQGKQNMLKLNNLVMSYHGNKRNLKGIPLEIIGVLNGSKSAWRWLSRKTVTWNIDKDIDYKKVTLIFLKIMTTITLSGLTISTATTRALNTSKWKSVASQQHRIIGPLYSPLPLIWRLALLCAKESHLSCGALTNFLG